MTLRLESEPPDGCGVGVGLGGGHVTEMHCAGAFCTPNVNATTKAENVRKSVRVMN